MLAQIIIALYNIYRGVKSKSSTLFPLISDLMVYTKVTEAWNHSLQRYFHASAVLCLLFLAKCIIHSVVIWNHIHVTLYKWHLSEYHGGQFYYWRKTEYPEKTSDMSQVTDKLYQIWVTYIVSYKKQELLTLREHLSLPSVFWWVGFAHLFSFVCVILLCVITFCSVMCCNVHITNYVWFVVTSTSL